MKTTKRLPQMTNEQTWLKCGSRCLLHGIPYFMTKFLDRLVSLALSLGKYGNKSGESNDWTLAVKRHCKINNKTIFQLVLRRKNVVKSSFSPSITNRKWPQVVVLADIQKCCFDRNKLQGLILAINIIFLEKSTTFQSPNIYGNM